jgi:translation elongation factor EF-Ts
VKKINNLHLSLGAGIMEDRKVLEEVQRNSDVAMVMLRKRSIVNVAEKESEKLRG